MVKYRSGGYTVYDVELYGLQNTDIKCVERENSLQNERPA